MPSNRDEKPAQAYHDLLEGVARIVERSGRPLVLTGTGEPEQGGKRTYYMVLGMAGRRKDLDEVLALMKEKYPNGGITLIEEHETEGKSAPEEEEQ